MTADPTIALFDSAGERRWYLVRSLVGRELVAEGQLRNQGFSTFLPKQLKTIRHARRLRVALSAFFPAYLFVRLDLGRDRWRSVNVTLGVACLVGPAASPTPVPSGVVEALIAAADARDVLAGPQLCAGQVRQRLGVGEAVVGVQEADGVAGGDPARISGGGRVITGPVARLLNRQRP